jgi:hypothetical protein
MALESIFGSTLLDASGQPNLVIDSSQNHDLIWTLVNNQDQELVVTPFDSGKVDQNQYHFVFDFGPGALTEAPTAQGWEVYTVRDDKGGIKSLYIALSGSKPLSIGPHGYHKTTLTYMRAIQEDSNNSKVTVHVTTGSQVTLGGIPIPKKSFGPFDLTLVQVKTPTLSVPPLAVDFVGRRTVLNDGQTSNSFTFALTNMTQADLPLTPMAEAGIHTIFIVWFDAAPNEAGQGYPWALARVQDLDSENFDLALPSDDWNKRKLVSGPMDLVVSPRWEITALNPVVLEPQDPVLFTFNGLQTDLDPGVTRMYLRFENLADFLPGVLIGELEKTPLLYGSKQGQGLYLSAGTPQGKTPPAPNYDSGLYVQRFGDGAAAVFNGGKVGIGTGAKPPAAKLHIVDTDQKPDGGTLILGSGNPAEPSLRFGCQPEYAWVQSHAGKPLVINPIPRNVGIGTAKPGSSLSVDGGVAIGKGYAQNTTTVADSNLAVEGRVGIGTTEPGSGLSVTGGVAIGKSYALKTTTVPENNLAVEGSVGIGTTTPESRLHVKSANGIKLSLEESGGGQLFISNSYNDNSVQLVATGHDDKPNKHTSANMLYLGGWAAPNPTLPKMILNANELDLQATTTAINGRVGIGGAADSQTPLVVHGDLTVDGFVNMGVHKLPATCAPEKLMIVHGVIWAVSTTNGLQFKTVGKGFSVKTSNAAGVWVIVFDQPFSDMPSVVTTPQFFGNEGSRAYNTSFLTYTSAGSITIRTGDLYYGDPAWNDFGFIAIGPI